MTDLVDVIRRTLTNPKRVCDQLGLKVRRDANSFVSICCPVHEERNPSCSVLVHQSGTLAVKCHACQWSGDVLHLIAAVHKLDAKRDFHAVLAIGADLCGLTEQANALRNGEPAPDAPAAQTVQTTEPREYPDRQSVDAFWELCTPVTDDVEASGVLIGRGIDPQRAANASLVRSLPEMVHHSRLPSWARYRGDREVSEGWGKTGHRVIVPVFDALGELRSVRAWLVRRSDDPKRLPPAGHNAAGLVMANPAARAVLAGQTGPRLIVVAEGEPDWLTLSVRWPWLAVFGVVSGSWTDEIASRIPFGSELVIRTHHDPAGEKYFAQVLKTVRDRAVVSRSAA